VLSPRAWFSFRNRARWLAMVVIGWPLVALATALLIPRLLRALG
jgi:hypothetical protein